MTISELIQRLELLKFRQGDLPVFGVDPDADKNSPHSYGELEREDAYIVMASGDHPVRVNIVRCVDLEDSHEGPI